MRILQLTNKIPYPPKDGGAIATLNLSMSFAGQGHDVTILGMNTHKHYVDLTLLPEHITEKIRILEVITDTSLSLLAATHNLLFSRMPYNGARFFTENYKKALIELLENEKFDVIQLEGLYLAFYIDIIRKYSNALISLRAHNIEHEIWDRTASQERSFWKKIYFGILARRIKKFKVKIINRYDLLVPITNRDAEKFKTFGNIKPFCTIPVGFDVEKAAPEVSCKEFPSLFFIGTLDWFPNQEGVLWFLNNAWRDVQKMYPDLKFYIAGRNAPHWLRKEFKRKNVVFLGEIDDALEFMNNYAIMLVPLFSGSGMRVKIIEGMALGKTIITTKLGAEGIDVLPNQNIIIEDTARGFVDQIDTMIRNKAIFDQIGQNAINFVKENFDNEKISARLIEFYQKQITND